MLVSDHYLRKLTHFSVPSLIESQAQKEAIFWLLFQVWCVILTVLQDFKSPLGLSVSKPLNKFSSKLEILRQHTPSTFSSLSKNCTSIL